MIPVYVTVGIGIWKIWTEVQLVACPHVGDRIVVHGITVDCERVSITDRKVFVEETVRFAAEEQMDEYVRAGWTKL